jgi:hypothetical protein
VHRIRHTEAVEHRRRAEHVEASDAPVEVRLVAFVRLATYTSHVVELAKHNVRTRGVYAEEFREV